jgi:hypothetical protein
MRALSYENLLKLRLEEIERDFPYGVIAVEVPEGQIGKWRPATKDERPHKTLVQLQKDAKQEKRMRPLRYPHKRSYMGYTDDPHMAMEKVPSPDKDVLDEFAEENQRKFQVVQAEEIAQRELRSLMASLRQVGKEAAKSGMDPVQAVAMAANRMLEQRRKAA